MWVRRALVAAAVAGLLLLAWLIWDHDEVMAAIERAPPLPFFAAMAILPALGVPATPLVLLAGASFGIPVALAGCLLSLAANLALCYWLASSGLRPRLESVLRRFERIPDFASERRGAARFTMFVKLTPGLPMFVKNYGLAVAGVPFGVYLGISMLISGIYYVALVVLGESLLAHARDRAVVTLAVAAPLALALLLWRRRAARKRSPLATGA